MHQLLLLRHAKSAWDEPGTPDRDRALNARGRRAGLAIRAAMRERGLEPNLILVSPARRTQETLALLEPWDDTPLVETLESLYLAPADRLLEELRLVAETVRSVLVIGHNPGLHDLAAQLLGPKGLDSDSPAVNHLIEGYPTGALAEFAVAGTWQGLDTGGARLLHFLRPKDLTGADA